MTIIDILKDWVKELRSGEYLQTDAQLCKFNKDTGDTGYCCLGVLAKNYGGNMTEYGYYGGLIDLKRDLLKVPLDLEFIQVRELSRFLKAKTNENSDVIAHNILDAEEYFVKAIQKSDYLETAFTIMNDSMGKTFDEIADIIEDCFINEHVNKNGVIKFTLIPNIRFDGTL